MRIALLFGPLCLSHRGGVFDLASPRTRAEGLTGSEIGFLRIAECMRDAGHDVELIVPSEQDEYAGMPVRRTPEGRYDAALAINEPDTLRAVNADVRACAVWLNDWSFARAGFDRYVDIYFSPSRAHLDMFRTKESWRRVEVSQQNPRGVELFPFRDEQWRVVPLGCDPERYAQAQRTRCPYNCDAGYESGGSRCPQGCDAGWEEFSPKISGRCIYASSPDRGLHHLLEQWPAIRRAVPHATLHIFYRLRPWIESMLSTPYPFPPVEVNRARAVYINEALTRMLAKPDSMGIVVRDSVSRETIEREMAQAECLAYPCDTLRWSEGFSCSILEACAARACPVVLETDALPDVYGGVVPMVDRRCISEWRDLVVRALTDAAWRDEVNGRCAAFAGTHTWADTAAKMLTEIQLEAARKKAA